MPILRSTTVGRLIDQGKCRCLEALFRKAELAGAAAIPNHGIASGAEYAYLNEENTTLAEIDQDAHRMHQDLRKTGVDSSLLSSTKRPMRTTTANSC